MKFKYDTHKKYDDCKSNYIYSDLHEIILKKDIICLSINGVVLSHNEFSVKQYYWRHDKSNSSEIIFNDSNSTLKKDDVVNIVYCVPGWLERWMRKFLVILSD